VQDLRADVRYALRQMRRAPAFAATAVATLALAIGANTVIFSLVNGLLLRELPVRDPQRLVTVSSAASLAQGYPAGYNGPMWDAIRQQAGAFDGALAWSGIGPSAIRFNLAPRGETDLVDGLFVSGEFFTTLGVPALLGRTFTAADDARGGGAEGPAAVISHGLWQRRFGGAADVIGRPLLVDGVPFTIAGVTPPGFLGVEVGQAFDVALPLGAEPLLHGKDSWLGIRFLAVMLRLKPGQSLDAAQAALRAAQPRIAEAAADQRTAFLDDPLSLVPAGTGSSQLRDQYARPLVTMLAIAALVLLIACANIANLMLARATSRRHELSVRLALGAPRWRLARQLLVESLVLAAAGAVAGLLFATWDSDALVAQLSTWFNRVVLPAPLDWRVMAFTATVTIATAAIFGTASAFYAARVPPIGALKDQAFTASRASAGFTTSSARGIFAARRLRLPGGLVIAQVALSLMLVFAAGLFVRTFERLATRPLGFDRDRVLVIKLDATRARIDASQRIAFYQTLTAAVAAVPGVAQAAASFNTPVNRGITPIGRFSVPGAPLPEARERVAVINYITPGWFAAYGTAVRAGRELDARDTRHAAPVVIVNEAFVRRFFPGRTRGPVGETIEATLGPPPAAPMPKTIVGVVEDAVDMTLRADAPPTVYTPMPQWELGMEPSRISLSVRPSSGEPALLARGVAAALTKVAPQVAFTMRPLAEQVNGELAQERLLALLSGFFGLVALLLAGLGLYGVTAYAVGGRRTEIGIRMALGAGRRGVVRLVVFRAAGLVCAGVLAGMAASAVLSRLVATLLYGVEPRDPVTLMTAAATLLTVGALAAWLPAWRASRIDPASVLRDH
jgi:predicted permease